MYIKTWYFVENQNIHFSSLYALQTANPGPGTYGEMKSSETKSSSFSKKGFGGFVSKVRSRFLHVGNRNQNVLIIMVRTTERILLLTEDNI